MVTVVEHDLQEEVAWPRLELLDLGWGRQKRGGDALARS